MVKARVFGENRDMQLLSLSGFHIAAKSCDGEPVTYQLLTANDLVEGEEVFNAFMDEELKKITNQEI
jgi:hypothetical protein